MDGPPSFTSAIARSYDQQQSQVIEPYQSGDDHYIPSISQIRSMEEDQQQSFGAGTVNRQIVQPTETYDDGGPAISIGAMAVRERESWRQQFPDQVNGTFNYSEQAPSIGSMARDGGNSQTAGGNLSYNAPPSYSDVAPRDGSYTGESVGDQNVPAGNYEGVSLTGSNFANLLPMMFQNQKEDEFNPYRF